MTIADRIKSAEASRDEAFRNNSISGIAYWDGYIDALKAESDVAEEIFAEIEKALSNARYISKTSRKTVKVEELKEQAEWILHEAVLQIIEPIKKKYAEDNGRDKIAEFGKYSPYAWRYTEGER